MELLLHTPSGTGRLADIYRDAFSSAVELFVVTAYLTEWDKSLALNPECKRFRMIIGKDFGITRKAACEDVMTWLPARRKSQFLVADSLMGFHPKAVFWRDQAGRHFAIVGSSNLTKAAFDSNYEVNIFSTISAKDFESAKNWISEIEEASVPVSEDWLDEYKEAPRNASHTARRGTASSEGALVSFKLPKPKGMREYIERRRGQIAAYQRSRSRLLAIFRKCANGSISSEDFYEKLQERWNSEIGNRLQGAGWERRGKSSNFQELARSYLKIFQATKQERDDVVSQEIDRLCELGNSSRASFLSEMLCLEFPFLYPVLDKPVRTYLKVIRFRAPRGASEGARYIDLAKKLRAAITQNPHHMAKSLAELDTVIWLEYGDK
ncbi:phospholipase D family protein [Herbaspirillum robiniae]|uniref:Phospholipase D-like domain-containing protein n=1 Tax=Herbaspirillum robiniae TaxID=2014887 RepID=A0A246WVX7_9BURK|nr:phospholipase D-like domain-containing protein [Herbaspirillum robiniae]OWY31203.1 hypothetical protein CEJ42_03895 [Herbaspirillum robiniae]